MNTDNPLLQRIHMPGETFRLPSGGFFYTDDELSESVRDGEVQVIPMTAIDEIVMKSPDKLFSGQAVEEVFGRCIPQILKPGRLLAKDVDHLLICLRKVSFGEEMEINFTHTCEDAAEHSYVIPVQDLIRSSRVIDPSTMATFTLKLDNDQIVVIEPIRFDDYTRLLQSNEDREFSSEEWKNVMLDSYSDIIQSVDDTVDGKLIREWLERIPVGWLHDISVAVDKTSNWGPTFETTVQCRDCGETTSLIAPLNPIAFFT